MRSERILSCLFGIFLSFSLSFSGGLILADGFSWLHPESASILAPDVSVLFFWCFGGALISSLLFVLSNSFWPLLLFPVTCIALWFLGDAESSFSDLVYLISSQYDLAYGWGVYHLTTLPPTQADPESAWILVSLLIAVFVSFVVCLRKRLIFALVPIILPVALCHVIRGKTASAPFLLVWLFCVVLLLFTQRFRRRDERNGNRLFLYTLLPCALATLLLFALVPQEGYTGKERASSLWLGLQDRFTQELHDLAAGGSSGSDQVRLDSLTRRFKSNATFMTVSGNANRVIYLRGHAYDTYTGHSFTDSGKEYDLPWSIGLEQEDYHLHVKTKTPEPVLYHPYLSDSISTGLRVYPNDDQLLEYDHIVRVPITGGEFLWDENHFTHLCKLPESTYTWSQTLLDEAKLVKANANLTASAISQFVGSSANYSLIPSRMSGIEDDFVRWFLTDGEAGYCSHFAASATVLLRAAGIPARYVTGYLVDMTGTDSVRVTNDNAHAWVEYWTRYEGWQILDPTPSGDEEPVSPSPVPESEPLPSSPPSTHESNLPSVSPGLPSLIPGFETTEEKVDIQLMLLSILKWVLWITIPLSLILFQWRIRVMLVSRRHKLGCANQKALSIFSHILRFGHAIGVRPPVTVVKLAQKARYSQHILEANELSILLDHLHVLQKTARKLPLLKKLYLRLILALY